MPLGRSHGYVNTWMWSPKMMAELAARALDADIEVDYVRRLVRERKLVPAEAPLEVESGRGRSRCSRSAASSPHRRAPGALRRQGRSASRWPSCRRSSRSGPAPCARARLTEALWPDADGDAATSRCPPRSIACAG